MGQWSDVHNITTKETMTFDLSQPCAAAFKSRQTLVFDKPGIMIGTYGYSFGEHLWMLLIRPVTEYTTLAVGVLNKRFSSTNKLYGA